MKKQTMFVFGAALLLLLCSGSESKARSVRHEFVRAGDAAAFPCENLQPGQEHCDGTTWVFIWAGDSGTSVELISLGQISPRVPQRLSERLSLTHDCGLHIKDVHSNEAGKYFCQQYASSGTGRPLVPDAEVTLSVVSVTEEDEKNFLELRCSVYTALDVSSIRVKWLYRGREIDQDHSEIKPVPLRGGLKINIPKSHFIYKDKHLLTCAVTHKDQTHLFCLKTQSKERTTERSSTKKKNGDEDDKGEEQGRGGSSGFKDWHWAAVAAAAVVLLLVALALVVWRRRRVKRRDPSVVSAEPEEVNYASINFHPSPRTEVRGGEEAVTYSSVRDQAPDSTQLYATIR